VPPWVNEPTSNSSPEGAAEQSLNVFPRGQSSRKIASVNKDRLTKERRSWNMSRIRGKDTTPEKAVRSRLHRMGYRFRLHVRKLPGRPDIVLPKHKTVVFVHGCFWHRHTGCRNCTTPTNRREWWLAKLNGNAARDKRHQVALKKLGWRCVVVWECETEKLKSLERLSSKLARLLRG
jgi:DNA mismatch endonuclease (patch repair protein)